MYSQSPMEPAALVMLWLAAVVSVAATLLMVVVAQGLAVVALGGGFIGLSIPPHLHPWALVNQPVLNFAASPSGAVYFLAGGAACLVVAIVAPSVVPRPSSMAAELGMIQLAWTAAVFGLGWMPLVDPWDGHVARFLRLRDIPESMTWVMPLVAAVVSLPALFRLLSVERAATLQLRGHRRVALVLVVLVLPTLTFAVGSVLVLSTLGWPETPLTGLGFLLADPRRAILGVIIPSLFALVVAGGHLPTVHRIRLRPADARSIALMALLALAAAVTVAAAGAPGADGSVGGLLWGHPGTRNNIRPWIEPHPFPPTMLP